MSCQPGTARPLISGAFIIVSTLTFLLMLAVAPVGFLAPRWGALVLGAALVASLILDWHRSKGVFAAK